MTAATTIWSILQRHAPRKQWVSSGDLFALVETYGHLDDEDLRPLSPHSRTPRWKINVRNVLLNRCEKGRVRRREGAGRRDGAAE